jgi:hypothetical protein
VTPVSTKLPISRNSSINRGRSGSRRFNKIKEID